MPKTYQISNNIVFRVNDDGSITKFAIISENGDINRVGDTVNIKKPHKVWGFWVAIFLLLIFGIVLFFKYNEAESNARWYQNQSRTYENKYNESQSEIKDLKREKEKLAEDKRSTEEALSTLKEKVGASYPLIISDISVGNMTQEGSMDTNYGSTIYSRNSMYLTPKITYYGINTGNKTLYVKLYKPDGTLATGSSSPSGYSYSNSLYVSPGANHTYAFSGWGSSTKGHWKSGTYRFEIWYGSICLKSKTFTIY